MKEKLKAYVNAQFRGAALTVQNAELREEILQNTLDRFDDLIAEGKDEQTAFDEAIAGIGDVSQLIEREIPIVPTPDPISKVFSENALPDDKVTFSETEKGKEWTWSAGPTRKMTNALNSLVWLVGIALYFLISFRYNLWYISWVTFLILPAVSCFLDAWAVAQKKGFPASKGGVIGGMWMLLLAAYFIVSFATKAWHITWVMFLLGTALCFVIDAYYDLERSHDEYE